MLTVGDLVQNIDDGDQMVMLILDFSKNFDEDPHERLMVKLTHYGIKEKTLEWIKSWLTKRTLSIVDQSPSQ